MNNRPERSNMTDVRWQDAEPPASRTGDGGRWGVIYEELTEEPGVWAIVADGDDFDDLSYGARALKSLGAETARRRNDNGEGVSLWARAL